MILLINIQNIARDKPAVRNACLFSGFRRLCDDIFRNIKSSSALRAKLHERQQLPPVITAELCGALSFKIHGPQLRRHVLTKKRQILVQ